MRICFRCKEEKSFTEFYKQNSPFPCHQYSRACIPCSKIIYKEWYAKNRAKKIAQTAVWREDNIQHRVEYDHKRYLNGETKAQLDPSYPSGKKFFIKQNELRKTDIITDAEIEALLISQNRKCNGCGEAVTTFEVDHIIALSKGGSHDVSNRQILCAPCNRRKGATDWSVFKARLDNGVYQNFVTEQTRYAV